MATTAIDKPKVHKNGASTFTSPLLDNGYFLSRAEFHRRYELMPALKKAELIEGIVIMGSPVSYHHGEATGQMGAWLATYAAHTAGVKCADNATVLLDADNEVQPDGLLLLEARAGGQTTLSQSKYIEGAPELVVEVAMSSVASDFHDKLHIYRRNRVREYLIWDLEGRRIEWLGWENGNYAPLKPAGAIVASKVFPGLWLDTTALLSGDLKKVLVQLQKGIDSAEHKQFVRTLAGKK